MNNKKLPALIALISLIFTPLTASANFANELKLLASDGAYQDSFGEAVAISGDTAIVGAIYDGDNGEHSGSAYIFVRDTNGNWAQQQKLLPSDGAAYDRFGEAVAISGDTVIIGAPYSNYTNPIGHAGAAYVFVRDTNGNWTQQQKLNPTSGSDTGRFGFSVAIHNDTAIIGAPKDDAAGTDAGRAYVYTRDTNGNWGQPAEFAPGDAGEFAGLSVDIHNDTAVVGVYFDLSYEGSAVVYVRDTNGNWSTQQKLTASDGATTDFFGVSVAVDNDTVAVGAYYDDDNGSNSGSAYAFVRDTNGIWSQQDKLLATDGTASDYFGHRISISGDRIVVGAVGDSDRGTDTGSAYVFSRDMNGNWSQLQKLESSDGSSYDEYGNSVSIDGDFIAIGAHRDDDSGLNSGSTYIYSWAAPAPEITITDQVVPANDLLVNFGSVTEFTAESETITVTNTGTADLTIGQIAQIDSLVNPFAFLLDTCSGLVLQPSTYCTINVSFYPTSSTSFSDSFDIPSDDADESPVTINLSGQGVGMAVPDITVTSTASPFTNYLISFGNIVEFESAFETITLTNDGNADLLIGNIANNNALAAPFSTSNDGCSGQSIAPSTSCSFRILFEPTFANDFSDNFDIPSDDPDETIITVSITGTGIAADDNLGGGSGGSIGWLELLLLPLAWKLVIQRHRKQFRAKT
ncbi:MAG: choice-of-anchor D domain-containing protein [Gammaproteobacteria bacterium]|nr:choice-of-anchor D domain-containing protein [Gammaproteobacteria bacterium]